jgi:hypothetical protein
MDDPKAHASTTLQKASIIYIFNAKALIKKLHQKSSILKKNHLQSNVSEIKSGRSKLVLQ